MNRRQFMKRILGIGASLSLPLPHVSKYLYNNSAKCLAGTDPAKIGKDYAIGGIVNLQKLAGLGPGNCMVAGPFEIKIIRPCFLSGSYRYPVLFGDIDA